jgi:hypothetical protein
MLFHFMSFIFLIILRTAAFLYPSPFISGRSFRNKYIFSNANAEQLPRQSLKFPYGYGSWSEVANGDYFFADKTKAIEELENYGKYLKCWRPRRSGKSLFCSQLSFYYDIKTSEEDWQRLFKDTYISKNPTKAKGSYLILHLSLSKIPATADVEKSFRKYINNSIKNFTKKYSNLIDTCEIDFDDHLTSLQNLFDVVADAGKQIFLIVDEYDSFVNQLILRVDTNTFDFGSSQYSSTVADKVSILRAWGNVLKSATEYATPAIGRMFFTGVTPMAFSDALSSFNIVEDVTFKKYTETLFGFTEEEVIAALAHACSQSEVDGHFKTMKEQFDGFRFNSKQQQAVFNPQMCLYYLKALQTTGEAPLQLLDPNMSSPGENIASYTIKNRRSADSFPLLSILTGYLKMKDPEPHFRSKELFESNTVDCALVKLAFYHGFLTFSRASADENSWNLQAPNLVYKKIFFDEVMKSLPQTYTERLYKALDIADTDKKCRKL